MSISRTYTNWAETYDSDRNLTRDLDRTVTSKMLTEHHYATILELGCGTGKNTSLLARIGNRVVSVDFSEGMIAKARQKVHQDNVAFSIIDLTRPWPFANNSFNLAVCNLVLEHIENLNFIFSEAQRVLRTSGRFFICELHPFRQYTGAKARFDRSEGRTEIPAFVHHISEFVHAGQASGFALADLGEWWHDEDQHGVPRVVSFMFERK